VCSAPLGGGWRDGGGGVCSAAPLGGGWRAGGGDPGSAASSILV
jgi:hypothetical protein